VTSLSLFSSCSAIHCACGRRVQYQKREGKARTTQRTWRDISWAVAVRRSDFFFFNCSTSTVLGARAVDHGSTSRSTIDGRRRESAYPSDDSPLVGNKLFQNQASVCSSVLKNLLASASYSVFVTL
jgi:hypothetical protein